MIIDSTAISKHFFGVVVIYAIVSASVTILLLFLQNLVLVVNKIPLPLPPTELDLSFLSLKKEQREKIQTKLESKITKYLLILLLFCFIYVGIEATIFIFLLCIAYIVIINLFQQKFKDEGSKQEIVEANEESSTYRFHKKIRSIAFLGMDRFILDAVNNFEKGEYLNFIISKVGILLLLFSFSLGVGRAIFVEKNIHITLNNGSELYVLYLTTSGGVGLFNIKQKQVRFTSWGNINKLIFIKGKRRSFGRLFKNKTEEVKKHNKPIKIGLA